MPCRDDGYECNPTADRDRYHKEFTHNSDVAEMLCAVMGIVDQANLDNLLYRSLGDHQYTQVQKWWIEHKKRDEEKRLREERLTAEAEIRRQGEEDIKRIRTNVSAQLRTLAGKTKK